MTDRGEAALRRTAARLEVGPSKMRWTNSQLIIDVDEISSLPLVNRIYGQIRLTPTAVTTTEVPLLPDNSHIWRPFAPVANISVDLNRPGWRWQGHGYFDANFGVRPLEHDFNYWTWGRFPLQNGAQCFYSANRLDGSELTTALAFDIHGNVRELPAPSPTPIPRSRWGVARVAHADAGFTPRQVKPMLDTPFYCRSAIQTQLNSEATIGVHETLDLRRYRNPLLKPMLAIRVPRRAHWAFA